MYLGERSGGILQNVPDLSSEIDISKLLSMQSSNTNLRTDFWPVLDEWTSAPGKRFLHGLKKLLLLVTLDFPEYSKAGTF